MVSGNDGSKVTDFYVSELNADARDAVGRQLSSMTDSALQSAMECGFEVIKHLAIFNGAGLAATLAIAQVAANDAHAKSMSMSGAHLFIAGLVFALVAMIAVYATGIIFIRHLIPATMGFILGANPMSGVRPPLRVYVLIGVNWTLAAISIAFFLAGAFRIVNIG